VFVRWDNLRIDTGDAEQHRLPGYRDPAVIRTFDAPEALDTRFYEVRAKSALNRVPERSRMPFRWTINPYRGCTHACSFCVAPETPVLLADGRAKAIADLRVGERIYGTVQRGSYRRYVTTQVFAQWRTLKDAYRVVLEDGTELVASGDHRFLSDRGWKYVTGAEQGSNRRPHLTTNNKLMGVGGFADPPEHTAEYERGYLCGLIRGDGSLGTYSYDRPGRTHGDVHRFRLALTDFEALRRAREYLAHIAIDTDEFLFSAAAGAHREVRAIRTQARGRVVAIREAVQWPRAPSAEWSKGFLAGIFDAEGCHSQGVLRISNTNQDVIDRTVGALGELGFPSVVEPSGKPNGLVNVRIPNGLAEHLRFFHTVDPAITRKRSIHGYALKSKARLQIVAIESLGERIRMVDITTGTGDFIANGVVSHNCFARPTHTYLDFNAGRDFEKEIVVKVNAPEVLRAELAKPSWKREHVAIGTNTDPYQWVEGRYRLMPEIWEALLESDTPCSVLTKSPLLLRDIEIMKRLAERVGFTAALSVPTIDEQAWRSTEPHTPHPRKRLEAVAELNRAGIPTGVLVAPLIPGVNDDPEQVEEIVDLATQAGATHINAITLHLRGEVRDVFFDWLWSQRPDLVPHYERLYRRGAYAPKAEQERLGELVAIARERAHRRHPDAVHPGPPRFHGATNGGADSGLDKPTRPEPIQGALF
jgi:DNA repair photolyase